jgi:hypothetical protein
MAMVQLQLKADLVPVDIGKHEVEQHDIDLRLDPVADIVVGNHDIIAVPGQKSADERCLGLIVFDQQYLCFCHAGPPMCGCGIAGAGSDYFIKRRQ